MTIEPLLLLLLAVAGAAGVYAWRRVARTRRGRQTLEAKKQALLEDSRRILDLRPGDVIEHYPESYLVDGSLLNDEEGFVWKTHLLGGASDGRDRWLSVEDDDRLEITLYEVLPAGRVQVTEPPPERLTVGEVTFSLVEHGTARVRKRDTHGTRDQGQCRYADYGGPGGAALAVEWWNDAPEVALGRPVREDELMILPGS